MNNLNKREEVSVAESNETTVKKKKLTLFNKIDLWRNIISILFYATFLTFNIIKGKGHVIINRVLVGITLGYLIFFIIVSIYDVKDKNVKVVKKMGVKTYKIMKKVMLLISAMLTVGTILSVHDETNWIQLTGTIFTVCNLIGQIVLVLISDIIFRKLKTIRENLKRKVKQ